jgi:glycosyltransferase involved in cell wall biosynthesis
MSDPARVFCPDAHLTYPHLNAFYDGGRRMVAARRDGETWSLLGIDLRDGSVQVLAPIDRGGDRELGGDAIPTFDVALDAGILVLKQQGAIWKLDLNGGAGYERIYQPAPGTRVNLKVCITHAGDKVLLTEDHDDGSYSAKWLQLSDGREEEIVRHDWWADHFQPCPHDESWVGYGKQTWGTPAYNQPGEIMWAWHREQAPQGRCIFDQFAVSQVPGKPLFTTHDRWAFHETCLVCIVYPASPGGPRGLYQVWPDGRARCVSDGDQDWHCDISRDGRWAVIDTSGVYGWNAPSIDALPGNSDIILIDMQSGQRHFLARTTWGGPQHPHPIFTPDGRRVLFHRSTYDDGIIRSDVMVAEVPVL